MKQWYALYVSLYSYGNRPAQPQSTVWQGYEHNGAAQQFVFSINHIPDSFTPAPAMGFMDDI